MHKSVPARFYEKNGRRSNGEKLMMTISKKIRKEFKPWLNLEFSPYYLFSSRRACYQTISNSSEGWSLIIASRIGEERLNQISLVI
jgi:hypothetical protein